MSNNKQSSVEWLISQLQKSKDWHRVLNEISQMSSARVDIIEQAKAMQKEQRINDFRAGIDCESDHHGYMWTDKNYPEQWYTDLQEGNNE